MPVELLISNTDANYQQRGEIVAYYESPHEWGNKEQLPGYVHLTISDASLEQVGNFLERWQIKFQHEILAENEQGYRIKVSVDPVWISVSDIGKDQMKTKMLDWAQNEYNCQQVNFTNELMTVDVPKPVDLVQMKKDFADIFDQVLNARRYYFSASEMDKAVSKGGKITMNKQQALNKVIDKLSE